MNKEGPTEIWIHALREAFQHKKRLEQAVISVARLAPTEEIKGKLHHFIQTINVMERDLLNELPQEVGELANFSSQQTVMDVADHFIMKLAEHHYEGNAPPNVKADDLDWIDEETRREIKENGKKEEYKPFDKPHNPPGAIASEKTWDKAKKAVKKYWKKYDEPWAVVYHVYKRMGGKPKKKSKKSK